MSSARIVAAAALVGRCASLLTVGLVSTPPTFWRHMVQAVPAVLVLAMVLGDVRGWPSAAGAIFIFWLLIVIAIWLFLLGAARIVSGTFSPAEIVLTRDIALCSLAGLTAAACALRNTGWLRGIMTFVMVTAVQFATMWLKHAADLPADLRAPSVPASASPDPVGPEDPRTYRFIW